MRDVTGILKYLPFVAVIYAIYEAYGERGISGFVSDLKSLPGILNNKEAQKQLLTGVVILIAGSFLVSKFATRGWMKYAAYAVIYYFAITQIATAIRSGAGGYSAGRLSSGNAARRR